MEVLAYRDILPGEEVTINCKKPSPSPPAFSLYV